MSFGKFLALVAVFGIAVYSLIHYTQKLLNDPFTRLYQVEFRVVKGLNGKSEVLARGVRVGKVKAIDLDQKKNVVKVTIKVLPGFMISRVDSQVQVVAANALGKQRIEIEPGDIRQDSDIYTFEEVIKGVNEKPSEFTAMIKRRDPAINEGIGEVVRVTRSLNDPTTGFGAMLNDRDLALGLHDAIREVRESARGLEKGTRDLEIGEGSFGPYLSSNSDALEDVRDSLYGLKRSLGDIVTSLKEANRGEGTLGEFLHSKDSSTGWKQTAKDLDNTTAGWNGPDNPLTSNDSFNGFADGAESFANAVRDLNKPEGFLGEAISDRAGAGRMEEALENFRFTMHEIAEGRGSAGQLLVDPDAGDRVDELLDSIKETTSEIDSGIRRSVAEQPVNKIHGAVFSVF